MSLSFFAKVVIGLLLIGIIVFGGVFFLKGDAVNNPVEKLSVDENVDKVNMSEDINLIKIEEIITEVDGGCGNGDWQISSFTNYESYPEPGSEECIKYNGCAWAGMFYGLEDKQTENWVKENNIVAVHERDWELFGMKKLKLRQGDNEIIVTVYDVCSDSDCGGCCTDNLGGDGFLIDIEKHTMERFGAGEGLVEFKVCE